MKHHDSCLSALLVVSAFRRRRSLTPGLNPEQAWRWMGRVVGEVVIVELAPRIGGAVRYLVRRDGRDIDHVGELIELDRPHPLAYTWAVPSFSQDTTLMSLRFAHWQHGAEVTLTQDRVQRELAAYRAQNRGRAEGAPRRRGERPRAVAGPERTAPRGGQPAESRAIRRDESHPARSGRNASQKSAARGWESGADSRVW